MADDSSFAELIGRIRGGDSHAAEELMRLYEPAIRREIRLRLGTCIRPLCDSIDICQSVFGSFFLGVVAGRYELQTPGRVLGLLIGMARNKIREKVRKRHEVNLDGIEPSDPESGPLSTILNRDLVDEFRKRLSDEEMILWELRRQDLPWNAIAFELGHTPQVLRKRYSRAVRRVAKELGLEDMI